MKIHKKGIQRRIAIFIFVVGMFPVMISILLVYLQGGRELRVSAGENFARVAKEIASNAEIVMEQSVHDVKSLAISPVLRNAAILANESYTGKDKGSIERHIQKIDMQWLQHGDKEKRFGAYVSSRAAQYLAEIKKNTEGYVELFITDTKGVLIASAGKTKYLYYGSEKWWQTAYNKGIGVIRAVSTIDKISKIVQKFRIGKTGHAMLINSVGIILLCPIFPPQVHRVTDELMNNITTAPLLGWAVVKDNAHEGINAVAGFAPIATTDIVKNAFDGNKWYIFVSQSPDESYAPIYVLLKRVFFLLIFSILILSAMGFWARKIVKPIETLR